MEKLTLGIKIYFENILEIRDRIWLSNGSLLASSAINDSRSFSSDAIIPQEPWRRPNDAELSCLLGYSSNLLDWEIGGSVGVIKIPDKILQILEPLNLESLSIEEIRDIRKHVAYGEVIDTFLESINLYCLRRNRIKILGIHATYPHLPTTTVEYSKSDGKKYFTGLHLDSWYRVPLAERHLSSNRFCLNLGKGDRFFLFVNQDLQRMFNALELNDPCDIEKHKMGTQVGHEFLLSNASYPIVRIMLRPGEAYIAPTENMIHDGSTLCSEFIDITLTILGDFGLGMLGEKQKRALSATSSEYFN